MLLLGKTLFKTAATLIMGPLLKASITKPPKLRPSKQYLKSPLADPIVKSTKNDQPFGQVQKPVFDHVIKEQRPKEVNDVLSKDKLTCLDLQFLAKILPGKNIILENNEILHIKHELKNVKDIEFHTIKDLLSLWSNLGLGSYPNSLKHSFISHFNRYQFQAEIVHHYPSQFLKPIAFQLFEIVFPRSKPESLEVLKQLGKMMNVEQIRKLDTYCSEAIYTMEPDMLVRFLNTFRQLKKRGAFTQQAVELIVHKKNEISPKYLLMTLICFYQLDHADKMHKFYPRLLSNIHHTSQQGGFQNKDVGALLNIMHKYKSGERALWQALQHRLDKDNQIAFDQMFAILSGLTRSYHPNVGLLIRMLDFQPSMDYVKQLKEVQFIEFFLVIYFHFEYLSPELVQKYQPIILSSLETTNLDSVYSQIKYFFLYLFSSEKEKQKHLKKAYPNDLMLAMLSLEFPIKQAVDVEEQQKYKSELSERYLDNQERWLNHTRMILVEQFIRYKLMVAKKDHFKNHFI